MTSFGINSLSFRNLSSLVFCSTGKSHTHNNLAKQYFLNILYKDNYIEGGLTLRITCLCFENADHFCAPQSFE